jgi:hypothetical protein
MTLIPEKQIAVNAKTKAIAAAQTAASGAVGLVRSTAAATADLVPVGTTGLDSIAAATPLEGRTAIGLGTLAIQNSDAVSVTGGATKGLTEAESDVFLNDSGQAVLRMFGDIYGGCELRLENRNGSNGAVFRNLNIPLVDFRFEAAGTNRAIQMRAEFRPFTWDSSGAELEFFVDGDASGGRLFSIGGNQIKSYKPIATVAIEAIASGAYTVSSLPPTTGIPGSRIIWVSNGRKFGETTGYGTGVWAAPLGGDWVNLNTNTIVSA